MLETVLGKI